LERKNRRIGAGFKIWLAAKRNIAEEFGYDPDNVSANDMRRVEDRFRAVHWIHSEVME
jgi:hypothetical protein